MDIVTIDGIDFDDPLSDREETLSTLRKDSEGSEIIDLLHYDRVFTPSLSCSLSRYALKKGKRGVVFLDDSKLSGEEKEKGLRIFKELGI